jgi:anti-anti-sigma regulatory factor
MATDHTHPTTDRPRGLLLDVAAQGRTTTVRLFGTLDALTARRVRNVARIGSVADARFVTLDVDRVTVTDAAGWQALRDLTADLVARGATVTQVGGRGRSERLDVLLRHLAPVSLTPTAA